MENPTQRIRGRCFLPTLRLPVTSQAWPYSPEDPLASQKGLKRDNDIWYPCPICQTRPRHGAQHSLAPSSMLSLLCLSFFGITVLSHRATWGVNRQGISHPTHKPPVTSHAAIFKESSRSPKSLCSQYRQLLKAGCHLFLSLTPSLRLVVLLSTEISLVGPGARLLGY